MLGAVAEAADDEGQAENQQAVAQHRADKRRLNHVDQAGAKSEDPDKQFRQVAQGRLKYSGGAGSKPRADFLSPISNQSGEQGQCGCRNGEGQHRELPTRITATTYQGGGHRRADA